MTTNAASLLGPRPDMRVWLGGRCVTVRRKVGRWLAGTLRPPTGPLDLAIICPETADEACYFAEKLRPRLSDDASIWLARDADEATTLSEFATLFRAALAPYGWSIGRPERLENLFLMRLNSPHR